MPGSTSGEHPRRIGQYEIVGAIGKGAMGQVYKAVQPSLNRIVALKVLPQEFLEDPTRVERFNREAQAVALLSHANIVQIIDKDRDGDTLFFVMEYVPGSSLDQLLRQRRLSLHEALTVFRGVCRGLEAAHRQSVIHRDLNPRNILVSDDLTVVKLADFGISKVESISREKGTLSTAEASIGTLHYMSPEQSVSAGSVDHRTDIYSAGVVLYEMLTGRVPVGRFNLPSQLNSEVPSELDPIVLKCLATEPRDRYPTVSQLLKAVGLLEDQLRLGLVNELRGITRSTSRIFRSSTRSLARNRKILIGAGAGLAIAVVAVAGAMLLGPAWRGLRVEAAPPFDPEGVVASLPSLGEVPLPEELEEPAEPAGGAPEPPTAARPAGASAAPARTQTQAAAEPLPAAAPAAASGDDEYRVAVDKLAARLYDPAIKDFEEFLRRFPDSPQAPGAYLAIAESQAGAGRIEQALAGFVEVQSRFPDAPEAAEAAYRQGELLLGTERPGRRKQALELFERVAVEHPSSGWAPLALLGKASIEQHEKLEADDPVAGGRVPAALLSYRAVAERYGATPHAEKALERLAGLYSEEKRFDLAAEAYERLASSFPGTRVDAWWEAGQLWDKKLDDAERALAAYRKVPASSRNYDGAQKRIAKLSR